MNSSLCFYFDTARSSQNEWLSHHKRRRTTHLKVTIKSTTDQTKTKTYWTSLSVPDDIRRSSTIQICQTMRIPVGPSHEFDFDFNTRAGVSLQFEIWGVLHPESKTKEQVLRPEPKKILLARSNEKSSQQYDIQIRENTPTSFDLRGGPGNDEELRRLEPLHQRTPDVQVGTLCLSVWLQPDKDVR